ncbi:hypothetical protein DFJ74DRAFT_707040 [Hyaloraphidium curvatum]|nr:hypothetical protein DFJ74DRAFT_707040 [Hyaloraphidium curvatum]
MRVDGEIFIITGATMGIGAALAERLASKGAKLVLAGRSVGPGQDLVKKLEDQYGRKGDYIFVKTDVGKMDEVRALFKATMDKFGDYGVLVNNAGISGIYLADVMKDQDTWMDTVNVNLTSTLLASRIALTHWVRNKRPGLILNTGSVSEFLAHTDPTYVITKAAMSAQVATIAEMGTLTGSPYARMGVCRANTIAVGFTFTDIWKNNSGGRWTTPQHVEADPAFGRDIKAAGGWTPLEKVVDTFMKVIEDDSINGETIIVSGSHPVMRRHFKRGQDAWEEMMKGKDVRELKL